MTTTTKRPVGRPARFTTEECREIDRLQREGTSYAQLARRYSVGVGTIDRAIRRVRPEHRPL